MAKEKLPKDVNIRNKKARFEYEILETYVAGLVLRGTEIKSIRMKNLHLQEAYCFINGNEAYIKGMNIAGYKNGTYNNHDPVRERKLLLQKKELEKIAKKLEEKGLTLIPLRVFINDRGFAKLEIGVAKGKKLYDKREDIKERDVKRRMAQENF